MRNASLAEALRRQVALDAETERAEQARQEAKAQQAAETLAAQQAWWAAVAQGEYQTEPPMTERERQAAQAQAKRERDAALDRQWAWEDAYRERYGRYPTDAETRAAGMWANG